MGPILKGMPIRLTPDFVIANEVKQSKPYNTVILLDCRVAIAPRKDFPELTG